MIKPVGGTNPSQIMVHLARLVLRDPSVGLPLFASSSEPEVDAASDGLSHGLFGLVGEADLPETAAHGG